MVTTYVSGQLRLGRWMVIALVAAAMVTWAPVANAHILKSDGPMTAELHIEPDDAPVAGTPFTYRLEFSETKGIFSVANCNCQATFSVGGQTVGRQNLAATQPTLSENTITLPRPDSYTVRVTGTPKTGAAFAPFTLTYTERIGSPTAAEPLSPLAWIGVGIAVIIMLILIVKAGRRNRARPPQ